MTPTAQARITGTQQRRLAAMRLAIALTASREFHVSQGTISPIATGRGWRHVDMSAPDAMP